MLAKTGTAIDAVVYVVTDDDVIMDRVTTRRVCEKCGASFNIKYMPSKVDGVCDSCGGRTIQRSDDNEETVAKRLATYKENTQPLIDFYQARGILVEGNNNVDSQTCIKNIEEGLAKLGLN
jgi:adenylate kinase